MQTMPSYLPESVENASGLMPQERDACAIIGYFNKNGYPSHSNVQRTIDGLIKMGHRAGEISGDGDGCGIMTDIPRGMWREILAREGHDPDLVKRKGFAVGHLLIPQEALEKDEQLIIRLMALIGRKGGNLLVELRDRVRTETLSARARAGAPVFLQIALLVQNKNPARTLYQIHRLIEERFDVHVASLSNTVTVYKVQGAPEVLRLYYPELKRKEFQSANTIGHSRFSTNTLPTVLRAQPFSLLGHNGEINTIARMREEARMLGFSLPPGGSDSQDLNRTLEGLIHQYRFSLFEAMEICFPPVTSERNKFPEGEQQAYTALRQFFGASAQGPAAIISRSQNQCVISVDAMGFRPLWFGETSDAYFASSEAGVVHQEEILRDPKILAPGEKLGLSLRPRQGVDVWSHDELRAEVVARVQQRSSAQHVKKETLCASDLEHLDTRECPHFRRTARLRQDNLLTGFAWKTSDTAELKHMAQTGHGPMASLGYDGPLAALAVTHQNLADYFKEQVAVVTNPAIDHKREIEHFSTRVFLGPRLHWGGRQEKNVSLTAPILTGGMRTEADAKGQHALAREFGLASLEAVLGAFCAGPRRHYRVLSCALKEKNTLAQTLDELCRSAVATAQKGYVIVLDDHAAFSPGHHFLDPLLALGAVNNALRHTMGGDGIPLRRRSAIIVRSGALRNLHDILLHKAMGADALCPYLMWEQAGAHEGGMENLIRVIMAGFEAVMSTMGTHEIDGYGKYFASVGLGPELVKLFETPNFYGSDRGGLSLARLEHNLRSRTSVVRSKTKQAVPTQFRLYPRIWKHVAAVAKMEENYTDLSRLIASFEKDHPLAIRHLLDFNFPGELRIDPEDVDTSVGRHAYPFLISAMSLGSQGEVAFRIYAEAAKKLNIICMNGEGGEIPDMLGKFREHRGQQIASGRFGVHMDLLNSADYLEIKVGQGAKPGEGGHLPGFKVTAKIAAARNSRPGVTLISPSNSHDVYSIEDLAQLIEELRTANPRARIGVKMPVVAGIGTIAMGVVKAGADILTVSGYDGGTGAAKRHAIKFAGLPVEIGVREVHRTLSCSGMRDKVELWADGGARTGRDVVKLMLLGANRVGFGTMPMIIIGCTACRQCHLGTCHVGVATQIESVEEAHERGLKHFVPRVKENGIIYEATFFRALGSEIAMLTAKLGFSRTQDLVGRSDLLWQSMRTEDLDLSDLLEVSACEIQPQPERGVRQLRRPLNYLTSLLSSMITDAFDSGDDEVRFTDDGINSCDRAIGTRLAGEMNQARHEGRYPHPKQAYLNFRRDSIPGNGLGAFNIDGINICVEGGAQDGVGKGAQGGRIVVLKGENSDSVRVGGGVGKGLAYGAQGGLFIIQGDADSRACTRLSGADVILGARLQKSLPGSDIAMANHANLKGFAFEYMTAGRVVVLGDPGPWICSGMTGGVIYCHLDKAKGMTRQELKKRLAKGADVDIRKLSENDIKELNDLLLEYHRELLHSFQNEEARIVSRIMTHSSTGFMKIVAREEEALKNSSIR